MERKSHHISKISDMPVENHYAIVRQTSVHVPGDERSRTNPGHGYPASTEYFLAYEAFLSREEWEAEVGRLSRCKERFRAFMVTPAQITTSVTVGLTPA